MDDDDGRIGIRSAPLIVFVSGAKKGLPSSLSRPVQYLSLSKHFLILKISQIIYSINLTSNDNNEILLKKANICISMMCIGTPSQCDKQIFLNFWTQCRYASFLSTVTSNHLYSLDRLHFDGYLMELTQELGYIYTCRLIEITLNASSLIAQVVSCHDVVKTLRW